MLIFIQWLMQSAIIPFVAGWLIGQYGVMLYFMVFKGMKYSRRSFVPFNGLWTTVKGFAIYFYDCLKRRK